METNTVVTEQDNNNQLARMIYQKTMNIMKFTLEMEEYSYKEQGRNDPKYKFFKKQLMSHTYDQLEILFEDLEDLGLIKPTEDDESLRFGFKSTPSAGSGYLNTPKLDKLLNSTSKS